MRAGRRAAAGAAIFTVVALFGGAAAAAPQARLTSEAQLDPVYAAKLRSGRLHVLTVNVMFTPVWLGNLAVTT